MSFLESCEFSSAASAASGCRVPRSCEDCLATLGCGIASDGQCRNTSSLSSDAARNGGVDFRNATFLDSSIVSNTSTFYFVAGTASYCATSDPVCTQCRDLFRQLNGSGSHVGTRFCRGDGGCVCIGSCELPQQQALDSNCEQSINATTHNYKKPLRRIVGKSYGDPRVPRIQLNQTSKLPETCKYTAMRDIRGCRLPRTSQGCLEMPGCQLSYGTCVSAVAGSNSSTIRWFADDFNSKCSQLTTPIEIDKSTSSAILIGVTIVLWCLYQCMYRGLKPRHVQLQEEAAHNSLWRHMLDAVPAVARLDLFGWRAHRERLFQQEERLLQGLPATSIVTHPVDFDNMDPSAPVFEEDDSSAPTASDPNALASAPLYRISLHRDDNPGAQLDDFSKPSAPDFE